MAAAGVSHQTALRWRGSRCAIGGGERFKICGAEGLRGFARGAAHAACVYRGNAGWDTRARAGRGGARFRRAERRRGGARPRAEGHGPFTQNRGRGECAWHSRACGPGGSRCRGEGPHRGCRWLARGAPIPRPPVQVDRQHSPSTAAALGRGPPQSRGWGRAVRSRGEGEGCKACEPLAVRRGVWRVEDRCRPALSWSLIGPTRGAKRWPLASGLINLLDQVNAPGQAPRSGHTAPASML
ncbi:MAG: hypothetical protein J3K34DRAFT_442716 [Monoraphidium minutum]|nr:MAG: hypothetical protein J3K34DRAFT_442716 [Monoraphidium minutum]